MSKSNNSRACGLAEAIASVGAPPCDTCRHYARCAAGRLACPSFALYVTYGHRLGPWAARIRRELVSLERRAREAPRADSRANARAQYRAREAELERIETELQVPRPERRPDRLTFLRVMSGQRAGEGRSREELAADQARALGYA